MAHGDERLGLAGQQLLEPEDAVDVEVVGGLVEQQQLGLAHQLARDGEPLLPAARQRRSSPAPRPRSPPCPSPRPRARRSRGGRAAGRRVPGAGPSRRSRTRREDGVLRHVADAQSLARGARTRRGRLDAGQDLEQRRLAGAVRAHEPDVVALEHAERQPVEERGSAERLARAPGRRRAAQPTGPAAARALSIMRRHLMLVRTGRSRQIDLRRYFYPGDIDRLKIPGYYNNRG